MPSSWGEMRELASTLALLTLAKEIGLDESACLAGSAITTIDIARQGGLIKTEQELQVVSNIQHLLEDYASFAFEAGLRMKFTEYGLFGMAMMASPTVETLWSTAVRFKTLSWVYCDLSVAYANNEIQLVADDSYLPEQLREFLFLRDIGSLFALSETILSHQKNYGRVEFKMPYRKGLKQYLGVLGGDVKFGQVKNLFSLPKSTASLALPNGNVKAYERWEEACKELLLDRQKKQGLSGLIRNKLAQQDLAKPSMENISSALALHPRTLRRMLKAENQTFQQLLEQYRRERAVQLLNNSKMPISDIAERLGYSEAACFSRAFKRWYAQSPKQYRLRPESRM